MRSASPSASLFEVAKLSLLDKVGIFDCRDRKETSMKHLDELKKQVKQPQGKGQTGKTADKNVRPGHTNQHSKSIISHNLGNR